MFVDARALPPHLTIRTQICIVGAGPAGMALATSLLRAGVKVVVLESGGLDNDCSARGQPTSDSDFEGHRGLWTTRRLGGNANRWMVDAGDGPHALRLLPLETAVFGARRGVSNAAWPLSPEELAPHLTRAQAWFELPERGYAADEWATADAPALPLDDTGLRTGMYQFADKRVLLQRHRQTLANARNVTLYEHATATRLESTPDGTRIVGVHATTEPGRTLTFEADTVILAQGGLATPQLLLSSPDAAGQAIGNRHDLVGRYFMDHPLLFGGTFVPRHRDLIDRMALYDLRRVDGQSAMAHLRLSDEVLRREDCVSLSALLFPRRAMSSRRQAGFEAAQRLRNARRDGGRMRKRDMARALAGIDGVGQQYYDRLYAPISHLGVGGWSEADAPSQRLDHFEVLHQAEQPPRHDNRVLLGEERDDLGQRRIRIDWRWHQDDKARVQRAQQIMARELARSGLGQFHVQQPLEVKSTSTTHFMGTTRMHDDPRQGVVDRDGRVHGVDNLYIAGSSVFPGAGYANPTLTLVALALRLGEQLRRQLRPAVLEKARARAETAAERT
jgi:choline dehydrogenase-like flavoprotein